MRSLSLAFGLPAPSTGSLLVRGTNSHIKPALKGEVDASATSRRRGCIVAAVIYGNPSVSLRSTAPRPGSLLVYRKPKAVPASGESGMAKP